MTTQEYRDLYGDLTQTNNYVYPNHFFANYDAFTLHIPFWEFLFEKLNFKNQKNLNFLEIGTAQGRSAVWLLENILVDDSCKLTSVDITHKTYLEKVKLKGGKKSGEEIYNLEYSNLENLKPYIIKNKFEFYQTTSDNFFNFLKSNVLVENDSYLGIEYKKINSTYKLI